MHVSGSLDALRSDTRGRPVWLMMTARAPAAPRSSQNVNVAVTPDCPNGRKDRVSGWLSRDHSSTANTPAAGPRRHPLRRAHPGRRSRTRSIRVPGRARRRAPVPIEAGAKADHAIALDGFAAGQVDSLDELIHLRVRAEFRWTSRKVGMPQPNSPAVIAIVNTSSVRLKPRCRSMAHPVQVLRRRG